MRATDHFINLSNGVNCPHYMSGAYRYFIRIGSTVCEQKHWPDVLLALTPDFLIAAANGNDVVVHDQSERNRETRAMWQGLSWARYAIRRTWWPGEYKRFPEFSRNGQDVTRYWNDAYRALSDSVRAHLKYYRRFVTIPADELSVRSCWGGVDEKARLKFGASAG